MAQPATKKSLTWDEQHDLIARGQSVIVNGQIVTRVEDLPPKPVSAPSVTPAVMPPASPTQESAPPADPPKKEPEPEDDGLDKLTKAQLIEIATREGSQPTTGTNDEIREGIRAKRASAQGGA